MLEVELRALKEKVEKGEKIKEQIRLLQTARNALNKGEFAILRVDWGIDSYIELGSCRRKATGCGIYGEELARKANELLIPWLDSSIKSLEDKFAEI